jgi:hypothetical protein
VRLLASTFLLYQGDKAKGCSAMLDNSAGAISMPFDIVPARDIMPAITNMMAATAISCQRQLWIHQFGGRTIIAPIKEKPMEVRYLHVFIMLLTSFGGVVAQEKALPQLSVTKIKVGESYKTDGGLPNGAESNNTWGKILQVIDDDSMLVGIDNGRQGNNPRYFVTVWCKFSTKGLTDGKTDFLAKILGTSQVTASGTTRYKTGAGDTRTVFVLEPYGKAKKWAARSKPFGF